MTETQKENARCAKQDFEDFNERAKKFHGQMQEVQEAQMETVKECWQNCFQQTVKLREAFAECVPDRIFFLPFVSPRAIVRQNTTIMKMANQHLLKQGDAIAEFCKKTQEQIKETASEVSQNFYEDAGKVCEEMAKKQEKDIEKMASEKD